MMRSQVQEKQLVIRISRRRRRRNRRNDLQSQIMSSISIGIRTTGTSSGQIAACHLSFSAVSVIHSVWIIFWACTTFAEKAPWACISNGFKRIFLTISNSSPKHGCTQRNSTIFKNTQNRRKISARRKSMTEKWLKHSLRKTLLSFTSASQNVAPKAEESSSARKLRSCVSSWTSIKKIRKRKWTSIWK